MDKMQFIQSHEKIVLLSFLVKNFEISAFYYN
jgi:hypothetical protein